MLFVAICETVTGERMETGQALEQQIAECRLCAERFAGTATRHSPRPVIWFRPSARILIAGQAPGARVHESGRPFTDASGDRLREWLGLNEARFYDKKQVAIVPMAFCFPGYDAKKADLPPPRLCARTWRAQVMQALPEIELTILVGGHAQKYHLGGSMRVTDRVMGWREHAPRIFPLPHPSWRNTAWLKRHAWFETDLLPALRARVKELMR